LFVLFVAEVTRVAAMPRSIPLFYFLLGTVVVGGARFAAKQVLWEPARSSVAGATVLIYGAGDAGRQLATALRTQGGGYVAGFVDDDEGLQGRDVMGLRVYPPAIIGDLIRDLGVSEIILSVTSIDTAQRRAIIAELGRLPVKIRTLPSISEIASGKYSVSQLREIDIDDLLGRSSVPSDPELLVRGRGPCLRSWVAPSLSPAAMPAPLLTAWASRPAGPEGKMPNSPSTPRPRFPRCLAVWGSWVHLRRKPVPASCRLRGSEGSRHAHRT
jgi:hypothetical protein